MRAARVILSARKAITFPRQEAISSWHIVLSVAKTQSSRLHLLPIFDIALWGVHQDSEELLNKELQMLVWSPMDCMGESSKGSAKTGFLSESVLFALYFNNIWRGSICEVHLCLQSFAGLSSLCDWTIPCAAGVEGQEDLLKLEESLWCYGLQKGWYHQIFPSNWPDFSRGST